MLQIHSKPTPTESPSYQSQHHLTREPGHPIILASHHYIASHQHTKADTSNTLQIKIYYVLKDVS